jgi:hypothetical protein
VLCGDQIPICTQFVVLSTALRMLVECLHYDKSLTFLLNSAVCSMSNILAFSGIAVATLTKSYVFRSPNASSYLFCYIRTLIAGTCVAWYITILILVHHSTLFKFRILPLICPLVPFTVWQICQLHWILIKVK